METTIEPARTLRPPQAHSLARSSLATALGSSWRLIAIDGVNIDVPVTPENIQDVQEVRLLPNMP
jgi:hypothetical protein